ncbi:MAG: FtsH protease activity modulator HflK [Nitrospinota bacterium]|nr:MAG: FtsH protease activity modulator HflK [Nitrospinota bacterium]
MAWDDFDQRRKGPDDRFDGGPQFNLPQLKLPNVQMGGPVIYVIIAALVLIWLGTGIYTVGPREQGVVLRFGRYVRTTTPGLHYHLPYPIETVFTPEVTEVRRVEIGFRTIDPGPPARYTNVPSESLMLTGDENIVDLDMIVQYVIRDARKFLFNVKDLPRTIKNASEAALREVIGRRNIDEALTTGKIPIQEDTKALLQQILDEYDAGVQVVAVQLQDVQPPAQVLDAFKDVASAREDKERMIREAEGYKNAILPETRGKVEKILREAEAYRAEKVKRAMGDAQRFLQVLREYKKAPDITQKRLYIETMEEILPGMEKFILDSGGKNSVLPLLPLGPQGVNIPASSQEKRQ